MKYPKYPKWHIDSDKTTIEQIVDRIAKSKTAKAAFNAAWQAYSYYTRNERVKNTYKLLLVAGRADATEFVPNEE